MSFRCDAVYGCNLPQPPRTQPKMLTVAIREVAYEGRHHEDYKKGGGVYKKKGYCDREHRGRGIEAASAEVKLCLRCSRLRGSERPEIIERGKTVFFVERHLNEDRERARRKRLFAQDGDEEDEN